jgi:hypothetical protein
MSCEKRFLNLQFERHSWRPRVLAFETLTFVETDVWARDVYRDYVRCDKQSICAVCGSANEVVTCLCDAQTAQQCRLLNEFKAAVWP